MTAQYDASYDTRVQKIFFNIWRKRRDVDYRFLGAKLRKLMAEWIEREKKGTLNTKLPPSPQYFEAEEGDEVAEVAPSNEVPEQAPQTNAREEEEIASNPSPVEDEPIPITLDEVPSANAKEEELVADTTDDAPPPA